MSVLLLKHTQGCDNSRDVHFLVGGSGPRPLPSNRRSSQAVWTELSQTACESVSASKDAFVLFALEMHTNRTFSFLLRVRVLDLVETRYTLLSRIYSNTSPPDLTTLAVLLLPSLSSFS